MLPSGTELLVNYIFDVKGIDRPSLAKILGVSQSKFLAWINGNLSTFDFRISIDLKSRLFAIAEVIETVDVEWSLLVKTEKNQDAWIRFVDKILMQFNEDCLIRELLQDTPDRQLADLVLLVKRLGASVEPTPPKSTRNPLSTLLFNLIQSWGHLVDWAEVVFSDFYQHDCPDEVFEGILEIKSLLLTLALEYEDTELMAQAGLVSNLISSAIAEARKEALELLHTLCTARKLLRLPLDRDYFELLKYDPEELWERSFHPSVIESPYEIHPLFEYLTLFERTTLLHLESISLQIRRQRDSSAI